MSVHVIPQTVVSCVVRSSEFFNFGQILGISDGVLFFTPFDVEMAYISQTMAFIVIAGGLRTQVIPKHDADGKLYLTTSPDGYLPNNLDYLPSCL